MKAVIILRDIAPNSAGVVDPLRIYESDIRKRLSLDYEIVEMDVKDEAKQGEAIGFLKRDFMEYGTVFLDMSLLRKSIYSFRKNFMEAVKGRIKSKVVFLDLSDSCRIHGSYFKDGRCNLDDINLMVKKQLYRDPAMYQRQHVDGRVFAEEFIRIYGAKPVFPKSDIVERGMEKVVLGWNLGFTERLYGQFKRQDFKPHKNKARKIDVHCRIRTDDGGYGDRSYYALHRSMALKKVNKLKDSYNILASNERIGEEKYLGELRDSRICVSPFGWGEICTRDFEAVINGCLLVKPSVGHLMTEPDIYDPFVTYVPVQWDLNDLKSKCRYYLEHPAERERIAANAGEAYARYFREDRFLDRMDNILGRVRSSTRVSL